VRALGSRPKSYTEGFVVTNSADGSRCLRLAQGIASYRVKTERRQNDGLFERAQLWEELVYGGENVGRGLVSAARACRQSCRRARNGQDWIDRMQYGPGIMVRQITEVDQRVGERLRMGLSQTQLGAAANAGAR
jgi:hypothetical protein